MTKINKFRNEEAQCLSKHIHASKFEAMYCNRLLAMKQRGEIGFYQSQVSFDLSAAGQVICRHVVDFLVFKKTYVEGSVANNGDLEAHEVKGFRTDLWEIKRKLFKINYPNIPYIVISRGNKSWNKKTLPPKMRHRLSRRSKSQLTAF